MYTISDSVEGSGPVPLGTTANNHLWTVMIYSRCESGEVLVGVSGVSFRTDMWEAGRGSKKMNSSSVSGRRHVYVFMFWQWAK